MKTKYAYTIIVLIAILIGIISAPVWAEEDGELLGSKLPALYFYAVNVGYKDDNSSQNYDFFELRKNIEGDLLLDDYEIIYTNSSGNASSPLSFQKGTSLRTESLTLGYAKSPQYSDASAEYLYNFSSSGLASTAGKLSLYFEDELIDEVCWGKITCDKQITKFVTTEEGNQSYVFESGEMTLQKYYPELKLDAL